MPALLKTKRFGWGVIFGLVTLLALLSYSSGKRYLAAVRAVEQTLVVNSAIDGALSLLKDAETGERGFVLTQDDQFLEPYHDAVRSIPPHFARLVSVTRDDPAQTLRLRRLTALVEQKLDFMDRAIRLRREGSLERSLELTRAGHGRALMDRIRAQCRDMLEQEARVLAERKREARRAELTASWGIGVGSLLTVSLALLSLLTVHRDVEELKRTAEELSKSEERYRLLAEQSSDLVRLLDPSGAVTYVSASVERILGYTVEEYLALPALSLLHPEELQLASSLLAQARSGAVDEGLSTYRLRHKSGEFRWFEVRWAVRRDAQGALLDIHTTGRDVTERRQAEQQLNLYADELRSLSLRDELTGLYNRRGFLEVAALAHSQALRDARCAALIFVDLNGMKRINDELGHDAGDTALSDTARVLTAALREADVVARLGGDEFAVFALDFAPAQLEPLRRRLREHADARVNELGRSFRLSMSVGAAFMAAGLDVTIAELLDQADAAMYEQKNARRLAGGVSLPPPAASE